MTGRCSSEAPTWFCGWMLGRQCLSSQFHSCPLQTGSPKLALITCVHADGGLTRTELLRGLWDQLPLMHLTPGPQSSEVGEPLSQVLFTHMTVVYPASLSLTTQACPACEKGAWPHITHLSLGVCHIMTYVLWVSSEGPY